MMNALANCFDERLIAHRFRVVSARSRDELTGSSRKLCQVFYIFRGEHTLAYDNGLRKESLSIGAIVNLAWLRGLLGQTLRIVVYYFL